MTEYKGLGSNAHTWARLKCPDMLRTYLKIAERMGLSMSHPGKSHLSYEYDPKKSVVPWEPRVFRRPWNHADNITIVRDIIIKELFDRDALLARYVDPDDLMPVHGVSPNQPTRISPGGPYHQLKSNFTQPLMQMKSATSSMVRDSDFNMYDNWFGRSLEQKLSGRIDRLEPPKRGILKGGRTRTSDFDNDVKVKYKPSWHESAYVTNSLAGRKLHEQMIKNSPELHQDDIFDESDFVDLS